MLFRSQRLYDQNVWNKAAVDAIVDSVVGYKLELVTSDELQANKQAGNPQQKATALHFLKVCGGKWPIEEVLKSCQRDFENTGNLYLELARDDAGRPAGLFYLPSNTVRRHKNYTVYRQMRGGNTAYFWEYGAPDKPANYGEVIHLYRPNYTSTYYGVPEHLAALLPCFRPEAHH